MHVYIPMQWLSLTHARIHMLTCWLSLTLLRDTTSRKCISRCCPHLGLLSRPLVFVLAHDCTLSPLLPSLSQKGHLQSASEPEFALCWVQDVKASYRLGEEKKREFVITSLGRMAFIKDGALLPSPTAVDFLRKGKYSACDHVASLRELKVEG
jgi:hypothetical protein